MRGDCRCAIGKRLKIYRYANGTITGTTVWKNVSTVVLGDNTYVARIVHYKRELKKKSLILEYREVRTLGQLIKIHF